MEESLKDKIGVVTFLDVLGWKGIWQRKDNPMNALVEVRKKLQSNSEIYSRGMSHVRQTSVLSISDTIVLLTEVSNIKNPTNALELHGQLCGEILFYSLELGIPLRGATGYGEFSVSEKDSIFVGKAIDETASWHEKADWIGVIMTPSAYYSCKEKDSKWWKKYKTPLKNGKEFETCACVWEEINSDAESEKKTADEITESFSILSPIVPEIVTKFSNTHNFLKFLEDSKNNKFN